MSVTGWKRNPGHMLITQDGGFNYEMRRLKDAKKVSLGGLNPSVFRRRLLSLSSMI